MRKVRKLISNKGEKKNVFRRNKNKLKKKGGGGGVCCQTRTNNLSPKE